MTNQQQPENLITPDEVSAAFGSIIGRVTFEKLESQKRAELLQVRIAELESAYLNLKEENSQLVANQIKYEDHIHELEKSLVTRPTSEQVAALEAQVKQLIEAGPTIAQMADAEASKAEERKEKEPPG